MIKAPKLFALIPLFCCWFLGQNDVLAQIDVTQMGFSPPVIPENYTEPICFEARVSGGPGSVAFQYNGIDRPMFDDGTHGDRVAGDGIWTILFQPSDILSKLTDDHRPFIGYCKPAGGGNYNIFGQIWTSDMGLVDVRQTDAGAQRTDNIVNFVASSDDLMNFKAVVWSKRFYQLYGDQFDFLNFVLVEGRRGNRYHSGVKNGISGIGLGVVDYTAQFGSEGRLQGYNVFPISSLFDAAASGFIHEIGHQWIDFLFGTPFESGIPHWPKGNIAANVMGFSIPPSGEGGQYWYTFTPYEDGSYIVGPGNGNNITLFNSMELYLMGLVPPDQVQPFFVLKNQYSDIRSGTILRASDITPVTVNDVIGASGPRIPDSATSQKAFRSAFIVLSSQLLDPYAMSFFDWFARRADAREQLVCSEGFWKSYWCNPFYLATGGRATMENGLSGLKTVELSIPAGGAKAVSTISGNGATVAGYAAATNHGAIPYGTSVLSFRQNGVTVCEAGVPTSPPTTSARIFIDFRTGVNAIPGRTNGGMIDINTGIAILNYGSAPANVTYTLRDLSGAILTRGGGLIAAGRHFARFIDQFKEIAPDFSMPEDFSDTTQFGSLEITSDQPISLLALRGTYNQRGEFLFTTTPIADLTQSVSYDPVYFPEFLDGGGYITSLLLLNTSNQMESGTLQILDDNGSPLVVGQVGGTKHFLFRYSIPPNGAFRFQTDGFPEHVEAGWVQLVPDTGSPAPIGEGVLSYNPGSILVSESGVPAAASTTHARIYVDLSKNHNTGLAIANIADAAAGISVNAFQSDGLTEAGTSQGLLQLPPVGHDAKFADEFIEGLPEGFTGVLDISSSTPFAALTIRSLENERRDFLFATFPIAYADQVSPSPIVFPEIVDGGGYLTEIIMIGAEGASATNLRFFGEDGKPLAILR